MRVAALIFVLFHCVSSARQTQRLTPLYEDFSSGKLDPNVWKIGKKAWGGYLADGETPANGGVVPENVQIVPRRNVGPDGSKYYLRLEVHGNKYSGNIMGIGYEGERKTKQRVGAMIATSEYMGSGAYEVRAKLTRYSPGNSIGGGVCNSFYTFMYESIKQNDRRWRDTPESRGADYAVNHEIDIEIPGNTHGANRVISYNYAMYTYWRGINGDGYGRKPYALWNGTSNGYDEYISNNYDMSTDLRQSDDVGPDGETGWRTYRFEWHTAGNKSVQYYIDGRLTYDSRSDAPLKGPLGKGVTGDFYVPFIASRFQIAAWFPYANNNHWAGEPEFDTDAMLIDYVKIVPYNENGDIKPRETTPDKGWCSLEEYPKTPVIVE